MRALILGLALAVALISTASADPPSFRAGVTRITVQDSTPFDALIAYPTEAAEVPVEEGPISLVASRDAPVAAGARFQQAFGQHFVLQLDAFGGYYESMGFGYGGRTEFRVEF